MLIGETVNEALNEQIGYEFSASLQYVAIAAYFETEGLTELADLFHQQSTEERDHAMRFVKYVTDAGGSLKIPAIPAPRAEFTDACDAIALSLESEQRVTQQINREHIDNIVNSAMDYSLNFDLQTPNFNDVKVISIHQILDINNNHKIKTSKRLGFQFSNETNK